MELSLVIALVALGGVLFTASAQALTASRSKYIEAIACERVRWIEELRTDFRDLFLTAIELRKSIIVEDHASNMSNQIELARLIGGIELKLVSRSPLEKAICSEMRNLRSISATSSSEEDSKAFGIHIANIRTLAKRLFKLEWEQTKYEASGIIGKLRSRKKIEKIEAEVANDIDRLPGLIPEF